MKPTVVVLSAFTTPFRSGAEACAEEVSAFLQHDYDTTIVTARLRRGLPVEDRLASGVRVVRVGFGFGFDKWLFPFLGAFAVRRMKPMIVHAVLESFAGMALVLCARIAPRSKRMLTCQSTNTSLLLKPMHRCADVITAISSPLVARAEEFGRMDACLIPNGVHTKAFHEARKHIKAVPGRILFVGRLEPMKGVDTLLGAFALLQDKTLHLRIVGTGSQFPMLERLAKKLGTADRVTFAGRVPPEKIAEEYAAAELFCALSRSEALGNVFLEAQAAGCAVVGTGIGGIPDVVKNGETGLLVRCDDPAGAADAIMRIRSDSKHTAYMREKAMKFAESFEWSAIAKRYGELYAGLLGY